MNKLFHEITQGFIDLLDAMDHWWGFKCECGGTFTNGGGYNHFSCNRCGKHNDDGKFT